MKIAILNLLVASMLLSCRAETTQATEEATETKQIASAEAATTAAAPATKNVYSGKYSWGDDSQGYFQTLHISANTAGAYAVRFSAAAIKGKPGCSFEGTGTMVNDTLKVPLEWHDKQVYMTLFAHGDTIQVFTENFDDRFALNYYCSGGGSLAGEYYRAVAH